MGGRMCFLCEYTLRVPCRVKKLLVPSVPDPKFTFPGLFESHHGNFQVSLALWAGSHPCASLEHNASHRRPPRIPKSGFSRNRPQRPAPRLVGSAHTRKACLFPGMFPGLVTASLPSASVCMWLLLLVCVSSSVLLRTLSLDAGPP